MEENISILGKKIFFLHPAAVVQNQVISELAQQEYEVYVIKNEDKLRQVLMKYTDSIVFASINEGMKETAWEAWIKGIISNSTTSSIDIGILVSVNDENIKRKYLQQLKVRCGYTVIKSDPGSVIKQLVVILNNVNAKGRRKYIRALTDGESNTTVNIPINGTYINGVIKDISAVGFSCSFAEDPELTKNKLFQDIQLRLQSQLLKAEGIIFGSRMDGTEKIYVALFTQRIDPDVRTKIRKYIQSNMQSKMDSEFR